MPASKIDLNDIWPEFSSGNSSEIAHRQNVSEGQLVTTVAQQVLDEANQLTGATSRHLMDLLVVGSLISMGLIFIFASRQSFPHGKSLQVVVVAPNGFSRYHVISPNDVALRSTPTLDNSLGRIEEAVGHYALEDVPPNAVIRTKQLSSGTITPAELNGREALVLPLKSGGLTPTRLPSRVSLYIPNKSGPVAKQQTFTLDDAYLLSISATQSFAVVAVTPAQAQVITSLLPTSDVYVSERIR